MFVVLVLVLRLLVGILLIVLWCVILGSVFGFPVWLCGLCCFSVCLIVIVASVLLLVYACEFLVIMLVAHMVYWLVWVLRFALVLWDEVGVLGGGCLLCIWVVSGFWFGVWFYAG